MLLGPDTRRRVRLPSVSPVQAAAEVGAGCRLAEDPYQWMDGGTWKGIMHEMIWDEDGEILALRPRPAAWHPPPPRPDYRCIG